MNEPFICYDVLNISKRARFNREDFSKVLEYMAEEVKALVDRASRENANIQLIESLKNIYDSLLKLREDINIKLEDIARDVDNLVRSDLCKLEKADICTFDKLQELIKDYSHRRALIECFKKNIVTCRDVTKEFIDLEKDEKVLEVLFYNLDGTIKKSYVTYKQNKLKIKEYTRPIVPATYEKCLNISVEA